MILSPMVTMHTLVKHGTTVPVNDNKSRHWCTMYVQRGLKTNLLYIQVGGGGSMWVVLNASENIHSGMNQDLGLQYSGVVIMLKICSI